MWNQISNDHHREGSLHLNVTIGDCRHLPEYGSAARAQIQKAGKALLHMFALQCCGLNLAETVQGLLSPMVDVSWVVTIRSY